MRSVICALALLALPTSAILPTSAMADDFNILRGTVATTNWGGFYAGGQVGADYNGVDFSSLAGPDLSKISTFSSVFDNIPLTSFPRLGALDTAKASYGFYLGYNVQYEDVVVGLELDVNKASLNASQTDSQTHSYFITANSTTYDTAYTVNSTGTVSIKNYGLINGRVGYVAGQFLPYMFGGLSIAQVNASSSVNVNVCGQATPYTCANPPPASTPPPPATLGGNWTVSDNNSGKYYFGFDAGVGLQWMMMPHVFLRGELQYIRFGSPDAIKLGATSARAGAGIQF